MEPTETKESGFSDKSAWRSARELNEEFDPDGTTIEGTFVSPSRYTDFGSTIRRLDPFYNHPMLKLMFGTREKIDFTKLIADGWVILVNLHRGYGITPMHTKLIGTAVINELIFAIETLRVDKEKQGKWRGRYYLYIDEAGEYANDKLVDLLYYKRQAGLAVILAHQINAQFQTPEVKEAVQGLTRMKVAFYQPLLKDRLETARMLYGGNIPDKEAEFALKKLRKQHAVIMTDDREPRFVRIADVSADKDPPREFVEQLYTQDFYLDPNEIIHDQKQRLYENTNEIRINDTSRKSAAPSKKGAKTAKKATRPADPRPETGGEPSGLPGWQELTQKLREDQDASGTDAGRQKKSSKRGKN